MNTTSRSIFDPSDTSEASPTASPADYDRYREMCVSAVAALVIGIASLPSLIFPALLVLPLVGVVVGAVALRKIKKRPHELMGQGIARVGLVLSLLLFVGGTTYAIRTYLTELPEGYRRTSFSELQPDKRKPELPVSPLALELDGSRVFIKGYIYPSDKSSQLNRFVLVPDMGTCCFGGQPKLTDMIEVTLDEGLLTNWSTRRRRIAGTLLVDTRKKPISGLDGVYYRLKADYLDGKFAQP